MTDYNIIADESEVSYGLVAGDTFYLAPDITITNSGSDVVVYQGQQTAGAPITIAGIVVQTGTNPNAISSVASNFVMDVESTGWIQGPNAVNLSTLGGIELTNAGSIDGTGRGLLLTNAATGPLDDWNITNSGRIRGNIDGNGIEIQNFFILADRMINITNSGTIAGGYSILANSFLIGQNAIALNVVNSGTMRGAINSAALEGNDLIINRADGVIDRIAEASFNLGGGNDRVVNHGKIDGWIYLAEGDDVYRGVGTGSAMGVDGDIGDDKLYGSDAVDVFTGGLGNDTLMGFGGDDWFYADDGADVIVGGAGFDTINLSLATSAQTLDLLNSSNNVGLTAGDTITGVEGIVGSAFGDTLVGSNAANRIEGGGGNDTLIGAGGADTLLGGNGIDWLVGGTGNDFLQGGNGNDLLWGDRGADTLQGGAGDDTLDGGSLRDNDLLVGGAGADTFVLYRAGGKDIVQDLSADDIVQLNGFSGTTAARVIAQYGTETAAGVQLRFSGADVVTFRGADLDLLEDVLILA